jgi:hypothetical protein
MEAWYENDWHLYDPDFEVVPRDETGVVLSVEELATDIHALKTAYHGVKSVAIPIIASREDNTFMSYPIGAQFEWKSQVLSRMEQIMEVLKFIIPLLLIGYGLFYMRQSGSGAGLDVT